jgi:hypothetical protein
LADYVVQNKKNGGDMRAVVLTLELPTFQEIDDPPQGATRHAIRRFEKMIDEQTKRELQLEENVRALYSIVWSQCTEAMKTRIEGMNNYQEISNNADGVELLTRSGISG